MYEEFECDIAMQIIGMHKMATSCFFWKFSLLFTVLFLILILRESCLSEETKKAEPKKRKEKDKKIGKNVMDYNEGDLHKLLDQWEVSTSLLLSTLIVCASY